MSIANDLAKLRGVHIQTIYNWRRAGKTDDEIRGGADHNGSTVNEYAGETFQDAQLRKESALASIRETELALKRGTVVNRAEAEIAFASQAQLTRVKICSIPNALCDQLAAMTDAGEIRLFLMREIDERLLHLSHEFSDIELMGGGGEGDTSAETADGDGMGGGEPNPE